MNDLTTTGGEPPTTFDNPLLDPMRFSRTLAVAEIMASASLIPESFRIEKVNGKEQPVGYETIKANCFLVANQAFKWGFDPFQMAQACSIVRGKLMYEGKLVAALIEKHLKVKLHPEYGVWDDKTETVILDGSMEQKSIDDLGVRLYEVTGTNADGNMILGRFIDGCVRYWKTTDGSSPWRAGNYRKMLFNRGAREFCRVFEPGLLMGVVPDDEAEFFENMKVINPKPAAAAQQTGDDVISRLRAKQSGKAGFDADRIAKSIDGDGEENEELDGATPSNEEEDGSKTDSSDAGEGDAPRTGSPSPDQSSTEQQADLLGDAAPKGGGAKATSPKAPSSSLNDTDRWYMLQMARMMWPTAKPNNGGVMTTQRKIFAESYPHAGISKVAIDKMKSAMDRMADVCSSSIDPTDALDIVAGIVGVDPAEILKQADAPNARP